MRQLLRKNGLSIVIVAMFIVMQFGLTVVGWLKSNDDRRAHGDIEILYREYLVSDDLIEAAAENWESEFLQMYLFIVLTTHLYQKGSATSKKLDEDNKVDEDPRLHTHDPDVPWPVKKGGLILAIYERSLGGAFLLLFITSFVFHAVFGAGAYSAEQIRHGGHAVDTWQYMQTAQFWFESLQNWQSEFLALACMVIFSIFLRQRYSPESKPVACPQDAN